MCRVVITKCASCSQTLTENLKKTCSWFSFLRRQTWRTCKNRDAAYGLVPDCAYCTPRKLSCFTEEDVREIALSLLSGVPDQGLIDDFAESPNFDIVEDLTELWLELGGWTLTDHNELKYGDFEIGEEESGEVEREVEDNADVGAKKVFDVKSMDTMTADSGKGIQDWMVAGDEEILAAKAGAAGDSASSSELSSRSRSILSFGGDHMTKMTAVDANKETLTMTREAFAMEDSRMTSDFAEELESIKIDLGQMSEALGVV